MQRSRFSENRIIRILKEAEAGLPVTDLSRTHGVSKSSFYKWKAKTVAWMRLTCGGCASCKMRTGV